MNVKEKPIGCLPYSPPLPQPGIKPETWVSALTGNRTPNPLMYRQHSNQLSHPARAHLSYVEHLLIALQHVKSKVNNSSCLRCLWGTKKQKPHTGSFILDPSEGRHFCLEVISCAPGPFTVGPSGLAVCRLLSNLPLGEGNRAGFRNFPPPCVLLAPTPVSSFPGVLYSCWSQEL